MRIREIRMLFSKAQCTSAATVVTLLALSAAGLSTSGNALNYASDDALHSVAQQKTEAIETTPEMRAQVLATLGTDGISETGSALMLPGGNHFLSLDPESEESAGALWEAPMQNPSQDPIRPVPPPAHPGDRTLPSEPVDQNNPGNPNNRGGVGSPGNTSGSGLGGRLSIVNIGRMIWQLIVNNQPYIHTKYMYATAIPSGVDDISALTGFSDMQFRSFRYSGKNVLGKKMFDVTYTLVHQYGGNYKGNGKYLVNTTVVPNKVDVLWGYTMNVAVENVSAMNVGTMESPVGGLTLEVAFQLETVIRKLHYRNLYAFRGDARDVQMMNSNNSIPTNPAR